MDQDLLNPSLDEESVQKLESYRLYRMWYVAFFGGVIGTMILATRNALWLKVSINKIKLLIALGILILIGEMTLLAWALDGPLTADSIVALNQRIDRQMVKWVHRLIPIGLFSLYYFIMKPKYQEFLITRDDFKPLLGDAIIWCLIGGILELIIVGTGGYLLSYVI